MILRSEHIVFIKVLILLMVRFEIQSLAIFSLRYIYKEIN